MRHVIRLLAISRRYWLWMSLAFIGMVTVTLAMLAGPWVLRSLISLIENNIRGETVHVSEIMSVSLILLVVYVIRPTMRVFQVWTAHVAGWGAVAEARKKLYNHLQTLSPRYYSDARTGQLMARVIHDTNHFEALIAHAIPEMTVSFMTVAGVAVALFWINTQLALYVLIPIPLIIIGVYFYNLIVRPLFRLAQAKIGDLSAALQDNLSGMREIQVFAQEHREKKRITNRVIDYSKTITKAISISAVFHGGLDFIAGLGTIFIVFIGGQLALQNQATIADIAGFLLYVNLFYEPVMRLGHINEHLQQALAAADRYFEVLDTKPEIADSKNAVELKNTQAHIMYDNVSFQYGDDVAVLKNINLEIKPGQMVALVGPTGVGKTTMANLIPRFYDPGQGQIMIDGIDIRQIKLSSLRRHISMVLQDVFLFNGSIASNIAYGSPDASRQQIEAAAKAAGSDEFISEMPDGYDTVIGERGIKLSGGQKQRVAIARALLYDAPILILDEATSSVDTETEAKIAVALRKLMEGRTTVVIAHRLSTIRHADKIVVLEEGEIVEQGSHDELINSDGLYARLVAGDSKIAD